MTEDPNKDSKKNLGIKLPKDFITNQKKIRELTPEEKAWTESIDYATTDSLPNEKNKSKDNS